MLGAFCLFAQVVATPLQFSPGERPVRLWLGASPVTSGSALPVYVSAANDGYLLVLRVATDGHVAVVFPADPKTNGFVTRGSYELRGNGGQPALIVNEGRGTGLVFAALSETPFRFTEFSSLGRWDGALLVASYAGADGPGTLNDIAQRMLGDGFFNSEYALYTVRSAEQAQRAAAQRAQAEAQRTSDLQEPRTVVTGPNGEELANCNGCTIVYQTVLPTPVLEQTVIEQAAVEPVAIYPSACDVYSGGCYYPGYFASSGRNRFQPYDRRKYPNFGRFKTEGICQIGIDCPPGQGGPAKAMTMRSGTLTMSPVARPLPAEPQLPPRYAVSGTTRTVTAAAGQRVLVRSKPTPLASKAPGPAVVRRTGGAFTMPARTKSGGGAVARAATVSGGKGVAMTSRQMGTAMRAAKLGGARTR
jgi:hypothetical protein